MPIGVAGLNGCPAPMLQAFVCNFFICFSFLLRRIAPEFVDRLFTPGTKAASATNPGRGELSLFGAANVRPALTKARFNCQSGKFFSETREAALSGPSPVFSACDRRQLAWSFLCENDLRRTDLGLFSSLSTSTAHYP